MLTKYATFYPRYWQQAGEYHDDVAITIYRGPVKRLYFRTREQAKRIKAKLNYTGEGMWIANKPNPNSFVRFVVVQAVTA